MAFKHLTLALLLTMLLGARSAEARSVSCEGLLEKVYAKVAMYLSSPQKVFDKLQSGASLNFFDRWWLKVGVKKIPFPRIRASVLDQISHRIPVSAENLDFIQKYVINSYKFKKLLDASFYKTRFVGGDPNLKITFGIEFEFTFDKNPNLVNVYRPLNYSLENWIELPFTERLSLAKEIHRKASTSDDLFVRLPGADENLPPTIFAEPHGTLEGNGIIFDNIGELFDFLEDFATQFGRVDFQGHVVHPHNVHLEGTAGYAIFESDFGQLSILEKNYHRFQEAL